MKTESALDVQVAGDHYKKLAIQPVQYIHANGIGYFEGNVIKYVSRWRDKNGLADLEKAKHYLELLIELETGPQLAKRASDPAWITWFGGEMPVPTDTSFKYVTRNGDIHGPTSCPEQLDWAHHDDPSDIISYRVFDNGLPT